MSEFPGYAIVGHGRWAKRMHSILVGENRSVSGIENARQGSTEESTAYRERMRSSFKATSAQIAWLCLPPGNHIPVLAEAALDAGLHVVVEKPWLCSAGETRRLEAVAKSHRALLAIHYEYCLMEAAEVWRGEWSASAGLEFGGRLNVNRPDHLGLSPLDNLGSHLFSLHEYCVPGSRIVEIECGYEKPNNRRVWLQKERQLVADIDLLANNEPIIQRFIALFEAGTRGGPFPFDLSFALRVAERTALWRKQGSSAKRR